MDPLISTPLLSLLLNANAVWKNRSHFSAKIVLPIAVFVLLGIIPGRLLLKFGSPQKLKLVLGLLMIGLGIEMLTRKPDEARKLNAVLRAACPFSPD